MPESPSVVERRLCHRASLIGELLTQWRLVPREGASRPASARSGATRSGSATTLDISFVIEAESRVVRIRVRGVNASTDHRLRLGVRTGIANAAVWADAAFGTVPRHPTAISREEAQVECAPNTAPLHRFVSLFSERAGATLFSDGLAEYEAKPDGTVWVTLLRAVGELSRNDLPERPGHAGWPTSTPRAQALGPFTANLGLLLHGPRDSDTIHEIERAADDVLLPLSGATLRSALRVPNPFFGVELEGTGLAISTIKESEDGAWLVVRCVNLTEHAQQGAWSFGRPLAEAAFARLDETRLDDSGRIARDRRGARSLSRRNRAEIVTILVR